MFKSACFIVAYTVDIDGVTGMFDSVNNGWIQIATREILNQKHYNTSAEVISIQEKHKVWNDTDSKWEHAKFGEDTSIKIIIRSQCDRRFDDDPTKWKFTCNPQQLIELLGPYQAAFMHRDYLAGKVKALEDQLKTTQAELEQLKAEKRERAKRVHEMKKEYAHLKGE